MTMTDAQATLRGLTSLLTTVADAGGLVSPELLEGSLYDALKVFGRNNIQFLHTPAIQPIATATRQYNVPIRGDENSCVLTVLFNREVTEDEIEIIRKNWRESRITKDPDKDLPGALVAQFAFELQDAYDRDGVAGSFQVKQIAMGQAIDYDRLKLQPKGTGNG